MKVFAILFLVTLPFFVFSRGHGTNLNLGARSYNYQINYAPLQFYCKKEESTYPYLRVGLYPDQNLLFYYYNSFDDNGSFGSNLPWSESIRPSHNQLLEQEYNLDLNKFDKENTVEWIAEGEVLSVKPGSKKIILELATDNDLETFYVELNNKPLIRIENELHCYVE